MTTRHPRPDGRLRTARLCLRPLGLRDAARLRRFAQDDQAAKAMACFPEPYALLDAPALARRAETADPSAEALFAVDHPAEGMIGTIGFGPDGVLATQVSCWIGRPYCRRGYATEVLVAALAWARDVWGRRCITAPHFADDAAAARVLSKAGFLYTGRTEMRPGRARPPALARWMVWVA